MEEIIADKDSTLEYESDYDGPNYGFYALIGLILSMILGLIGFFMFGHYWYFTDVPYNDYNKPLENAHSMVNVSLALMGVSFILFLTSIGLYVADRNQRKRLEVKTEHSKLYGWLAVAVVVAAILWFCHGYGLF